jgi:sugar-phosphatase
VEDLAKSLVNRAVIFDMDGVLVDSEPYWREGFRAAMQVIAADLGRAVPSMTDDDLRTYEGGRVPDTVRTLAAKVFEPVPDATIDRAVDAAVDRASELVAEDAHGIQASVDTAKELHQRGFQLGVASSSAPTFIELVVDKLGLAPFVDVTESAFFLQHPKPFPEVYENAVRAMKVATEDCLAIEDSWTGVQSALRAGLRTVWITEEAEDAAQAMVEELWASDPSRSDRPAPSLMLTQALDADAVQKFSEA